VDSYSKYDMKAYSDLVRAVGALSKLYSESETPLIHPRFVEKLFCHLTGARDLARDDTSFDAIMGKAVGVGVKTFRSEGVHRSRLEKVAEFTKVAASGFFQNRTKEELAFVVAELRNSRVASDSAEYNIEIDSSFYHCLVRLSGAAFVHEEPYTPIDIEQVVPTSSTGTEVAKFSADTAGHVYFADGSNSYMFNTSKNVLYKRFEMKKHFNSAIFPIRIDQDIFSKIEGLFDAQTPTSEAGSRDSVIANPSVVLPLYSTTGGGRHVSARSGINQWNAAGRIRKFGEAYIPVPIAVHRKNPDFFPARDVKFSLMLPNGKEISAKICQQDGKALMSDPNTDLCDWLFSVVDGNLEVASRRLTRREPYAYSDLVRIGKDSVRITRTNVDPLRYELETCDLGSFEDEMNESPEL
jgi:hypothetical protein